MRAPCSSARPSVAVGLLDDVLAEPLFRAAVRGGRTYADKIGPADRELDLDAEPEASLRRIRALSPHIGARAELDGRT